MPRTKVIKQKKTENKSIAGADKIEEIINELNQLEQKMLNDMKQKYEEMKIAAIMFYAEANSIPSIAKTKTIAELRTGGYNSTLCTTVNDTKSMPGMNSTKNNRTKTQKRSLSFIEDEGYLTAESNGTSGESRRGRSISKVQTDRVSRSLSRSKIQKSVPVHSAYKTPQNRTNMPSTFGTVTPKIKPNTPQVVLRRPKQGEMALSMQGSPLMVSSVVSDAIANVNIPLQDGRMISIQPQRGLRASQLPAIDADTRRQIEALRDNLNKVCALVANK